jgi:hypothetical protein
MELNGYPVDAESGFAFQNETRTNPYSFFIYRVSAEELEGLGFSSREEVSLQH